MQNYTTGKPRVAANFLYLVGEPNGSFKVGTTSDMRRRISKMQSDCPYPLTIAGLKETIHAERIEKLLHHKFAEYHCQGEWYRIPSVEAWERAADQAINSLATSQQEGQYQEPLPTKRLRSRISRPEWEIAFADYKYKPLPLSREAAIEPPKIRQVDEYKPGEPVEPIGLPSFPRLPGRAQCLVFEAKRLARKDVLTRITKGRFF